MNRVKVSRRSREGQMIVRLSGDGQVIMVRLWSSDGQVKFM